MLYLNFKNWPIIDLVNKLYIISNKILQKRKAVIHTEEKCTHGSVLGMLSLATPDCVLTNWLRKTAIIKGSTRLCSRGFMHNCAKIAHYSNFFLSFTIKFNNFPLIFFIRKHFSVEKSSRNLLICIWIWMKHQLTTDLHDLPPRWSNRCATFI